MSEIYSREYYGLMSILCEMKDEAIRLGRLPKDWTSWDFDQRYHRAEKPFRCIAYNEIVRNINILERIFRRIKDEDEVINEVNSII